MVKVAVAGGTGGVGLAIVEALKEQSQHEFILLSRNENSTFAAEKKVEVVQIDYSDVSSISKVLDKQKIHTVISALCIVTQEHSDAQVNLVHAAAASESVKRFVPSEYGSNYEEKHALTRPTTALKAIAITELAKTNLEYTSFVNGLFLDYLGMPAVPSHLDAGLNFFDIPKRIAVPIGTGKVPLVMTYTRDVARFVVASLSLEKWEQRSYIVGDRKSWHEVVEILGKVAGGEFTIVDDPSSIIAGRVVEAPAHRAAYSSSLKEHGDWFEAGAFSFDVEVPNSVYLNELFPEIVPLTVEDAMRAQVLLSQKS
ncbi:Oxidoreductase boa1 [Ciborinia camelliae]|nr:Oxidoreductase boa1 [Ciborinia camelliae]